MNISIINKEELERIPFEPHGENQSISTWVLLKFQIEKDINKTGLLFFLESNTEDIFFRGESGHDVEKFKFGRRKPLKIKDTLERRIRFFTPNSIDEIVSMNFIIKLYSIIDEEIQEDDVICKVKRA